MWFIERMKRQKHTSIPLFQLCCRNGKVQLPTLKEPPEPLRHLLFDHDDANSRKFQNHLRTYNMMFAFTSPGAKLDNRFNSGRGPPNIRIQGQTCHRMGSLLPKPGDPPKFAQLYIYDTENEIQNRLHHVRFNF
jgi:hypothetical protein